jgi:hypothetical protein
MTTEVTAMNYHGTQAKLYWSRHLPASYSRIEDPEKFFENLGEQAGGEIEDLYLEYAGPEVPGETAEEKEQRLTQAMNRATEEVYAYLVTPSPASQGEQTEDQDQEISPAS